MPGQRYASSIYPASEFRSTYHPRQTTLAPKPALPPKMPSYDPEKYRDGPLFEAYEYMNPNAPMPNAPNSAVQNTSPHHAHHYESSTEDLIYKEKRTQQGAFGHEKKKRAPSIIFGMSLRTFLLVAALILLVVAGAAVGGAVGGRNLQNNAQTASLNSTVAQSDNLASGSPITSTYAAPVPTYTALSDCPQADHTFYTSQYASGTSGTMSPAMGLNFTRHCDIDSPLVKANQAVHLGEAYVYSFNDCIELCAGHNFWAVDQSCSIAVYQRGGLRPGNCWIGSATLKGGVSALGYMAGTDIAVLAPRS